MDKTDFKKLDVERAKIAVAVQEARDLVASMLGPGFDEPEPEKPIIVASSSVAGLGYKKDGPVQPSQSKALEKLKKAHKYAVPKPTKPAQESEDEEEEESRTSSVRKQKRGMSALDAYARNKKSKRK